MSAPRRRPGRSRTPSARGADAAFGYMIPFFLMCIAAYQQVTSGQIDKFVLGGLMVFGLGALGWRLDVMFESYMRARYGEGVGPAEPTNTGDTP